MKAAHHPIKDIVREATPGQINERIDREIYDNIDYYSTEPSSIIEARINDLDKEWDIERTLELNASLFARTGVILAATVSRKWLVLPAIVTTFLAQHALQGWCPPLPLFRLFNIRTRKEIDKEKYGLLEVLNKK